MSDLRTENPCVSLPISVGAVSDTGLREQNQDCMTGIASPFGAVYLIADGMGGHHGGAEASRRVVESFGRHFLAFPASTPARDALNLAVRLANVDVLEISKSGHPDFAGMGSTVAIALIRQADSRLELITAHVGDSRVYLHRGGVLTLLTRDHTQVQWLIDTQALDEESARNHPNASVLTRAMGHTTDLQADISEPIPLYEGDGILICSDGLSGFANAEDINKVIERNPEPSSCAQQLVQLALASGSDDNITVQFLRVGLIPQEIVPGRAIPPEISAVASIAKKEAQPRKKAWIGIIAAVVCVLILAGVALVWLRLHQQKSAKAADQEIQKLIQQVRNDAKQAKVVQDKAKPDRDLVGSVVSKSRGTAQTKWKTLSANFNQLATDSQNLSEQFERTAGDLQRIVGATPAQRQQQVNKTRDEIAPMEKMLGARQKRLTELELGLPKSPVRPANRSSVSKNSTMKVIPSQTETMQH